MRIVAGDHYLEKFAIDAASTAIVAGALMTFGDTDETNRGCAIISGAAAADALGVIVAAFATADNSTPEDGLAYTKREIDVARPGALLDAEYSQATADCVAVSGGSSAATVTIASLEDDLDGSWLYATEGPGAGHLGYIKTGSSGSCVLKSNPHTAFTSSTYVAKILSFGKTLAVLTSDRSKLASTDAVGTARLNIMYSEVSYDGSNGWERLDPTKHDGLNLAGKNAKFRSAFTLADSFFCPLD